MTMFRHQVSKQIPPASEIATLAAILSHGRDITTPTNLKFIANQSIALWEECDAARKRRIDMLAIYARAKAKQDALPKPKSYPVCFEVFLKMMMPKKRPEDRMKCYREYVRSRIEERKVINGGEGENPNISAEQEMERWIADERSKPLQASNNMR